MQEPAREGAIDYHYFDKPAVARKHANAAHASASSYNTPAPAVASSAPAKPSTPTVNHELDYLDIPAFLRRKEEVVD